MDFAVLGGDGRQARLARLLERDGHTVRCAALEGGGVPCLPLRDALERARFVVLPLPAAAGEYLNAPLSEEKLSLEELAGLIAPSQIVLAGKPGDRLEGLLRGRGIRCADYFLREELTVRNAAFTAEGALEILMRELSVALLGARVLVIGFGRIGKFLSLRLQLLGARVTASARRPEDMAWIECLGLRRADTRRLSGTLSGYDAVVNTVPAPVLNGELLAQLDRDCLCLDLASLPGGVDLEEARRLGVRAIRALALPGKTAPVSSGAAIRDAIYNIISELECE